MNYSESLAYIFDFTMNQCKTTSFRQSESISFYNLVTGFFMSQPLITKL